MNAHLSSFILAYQVNCNTQNVLLRILEKWREHLDNNIIVRGILMDLSKVLIALHMISYLLN